MTEARRSGGELRYILYNPKDGKIVGTYARYDAEKAAYVQCDPKEVAEAALDASPELGKGAFEVLEVAVGDSVELQDLKVNLKAKSLVPRKGSQASRKS